MLGPAFLFRAIFLGAFFVLLVRRREFYADAACISRGVQVDNYKYIIAASRDVSKQKGSLFHPSLQQRNNQIEKEFPRLRFAIEWKAWLLFSAGTMYASYVAAQYAMSLPIHARMGYFAENADFGVIYSYSGTVMALTLLLVDFFRPLFIRIHLKLRVPLGFILHLFELIGYIAAVYVGIAVFQSQTAVGFLGAFVFTSFRALRKLVL